MTESNRAGRRTEVLVAAFCLAWLPHLALSATQCINAGAPAPLEVCVKDDGSTATWVDQPNNPRVNQYYSDYSWGFAIFLDGTDASQAYGSRYFAPTWVRPPSPSLVTPVSNALRGSGTAADPFVITTVVDLGTTGVRLTQHSAYVNGDRTIRRTWSLDNTSASSTFSDVRFFFGGDTYFGGDDNARTWWDAGKQMVYVTNPSFGDTGLMGLFPDPATPVSAYFAGVYFINSNVVDAGQLPSTSDPRFVDASYSLQWNRASLAPGAMWTLEAYEIWTPPGVLQVIAPAEEYVPPGATLERMFQVQNLSSVSETVRLAAVSAPADWNVVLPNGSTIAMNSQELIDVPVRIEVPAGAAGGTIRSIELTATARGGGRPRSNTAAMRLIVVSASPQFTINHDKFGISCVGETITVNVVDANSGAAQIDYNADVRLDTQTGRGAWALVSGSGTLTDGTADDGIANYVWPLGESQAVFRLTYRQGAAEVDVDVFQVSDPDIRDTDAEGNLVFSPNGFTITAAALANPPGTIVPFQSTQTAGAPFDLHLAAYGQTPGDPTCGVIESYTGAKNLEFWFAYVDPASGTRRFSIDGASTAVTEATANVQAVTFTNGQAKVKGKYKDAGRLQLFVKDDTTVDPAELPNGIRGASANFVVKPYDFRLSNIQSVAGKPNPQATNDAGGVFIAAGDPFKATVTALDFEGDATPNYGRESLAETVRLEIDLVAPAGGSSPAIAAATGFGGFSGGVASGDDFTWPEVGIIRLRPAVGDADYLGAGDLFGAASEHVGRFVPHHFDVALNSPYFQTACAAGGFTYQGQRFGYGLAPIATVTAMSASGSTTQNYTGDFFKLATSTLQNRTYQPSSRLDATGLPPASTDPVVAETGAGIGTLTFSSGAGLAFTRALQAPFEANIALSIDVLDSDDVAASNPVVFGAVTGIPFTDGAQIRYGRVRLGNATGSERVDLPVPMRAEYYGGSSVGFLANAGDSCTDNVTLSFSGYTENLNAGETCALDDGSPGASGVGCAAASPGPMRFALPPSGGDFNLRLAAPGVGNSGGVAIEAAVPNWLEYDWDAAVPGDEDPSGHATFGIYGGDAREIYLREVY